MGLCLFNEFLFHGKSDGLTSLNSQKSVENALNISSYHLKSMHHDVTSIPQVYDILLGNIDESIGELRQKKNIRRLV